MNQETTPPPTPVELPNLSSNASISVLFECLLKHPQSLIASLSESDHSSPLITKLLLIALAGFLIFALTLGSFSFGHQIWAAPLKTIFGIAVSGAICLPSLYIFSALTGATLGLKEIAQSFVAALTLMAALLLGFTPVLWVFSQSTDSSAFFGFLVLLAWLISVFFGSGILLKILKQKSPITTAPLRIWIGIFLLVTLQMSTSLRPIIGTSDHFFTTEKRFFLEHWGLEMSSRYEDPPSGLSPSERRNQGTNPYLDQ